MFALRMNGAVGPTSRVDGQYNSFVLGQDGKMHFKGKRKANIYSPVSCLCCWY